jgi:hypothetical protein
MQQRPLSSVPKTAILGLVSALLMQYAWHQGDAKPRAKAEDLPPAPSYLSLRLMSVGEPIALAKWNMLSLQAYDYQPGISIPFRDLDYKRVSNWLGRIVELDPPAQYPLLAAARLYSEVPDPPRQRLMMEFVYQRFLEDPERRWESLAHCAIIAKHRLHDLPLARRYAKALREKATNSTVPAWVRQMDIFLLEDMNELESAKILLGGILHSRKVTDPQELHFLHERMRELEEKTSYANRLLQEHALPSLPAPQAPVQEYLPKTP